MGGAGPERLVAVALGVALLMIPAARAHASHGNPSSTPASVTVSPAIETLAAGQTLAPSATVRDSAGFVASGALVDFRVIAGTHDDNDFDDHPFTPGGFIGVCETNSSGFCSVSYQGVEVTVDTLQALVDFDHDGVADDGEPVTTATIDWRAPGHGPVRVRIDMHGCDGDTVAPIDESTWNDTAEEKVVGGIARICAARFDPADEPAPGPATFTIVGGPGVFTDPTGAANLGTETSVDPESGVVSIHIRSFVSGVSDVRVSSGSLSAQGSAPWTPDVARRLTVTPPAGAASGTQRDVAATVLDRFANPVPGVEVTFAEDGTGRFVSGETSVAATTGPSGVALARVATDPGEIGTQTVTATISPASTDCEREAGDPLGAPAGVCSAEAAIAWHEASALLDLDVTPAIGVWGTTFAVSGSLTAGGAPIQAVEVLVYKRPVGAGPEAWKMHGSMTTDEQGRYAAADRPSLHTEYRAVFAGGDGYLPTGSGPDRADVRVGIHLNQSATTLRGGQTVIFTGRILPEHPRHLVYLQQLTHAGWRTIATSRTGPNSWYQFRVAKRTPGGLLFRTVTPSDFHHAWNASLNRYVLWR